MSTPPPPMSSPQPVEPGLSEGSRIMNSFIAPSKTFADLRTNPRWWMAWLLTAVFLLISAVVIVQKVDMEQMVRHRVEQSKMAQRQMERLSPVQQEQSMRMQVMINKAQFFFRPAFALIGGLIVAAVLMAIFNFGMAAEIPFQRALAVVFYAGLPVAAVKAALLCLSLFVSADPSGIDPDINPVATNPAFFMERATASKFLYGVVSGVDVLAIWSVILLGIGFAIAANNRKISKGTAIATMFAIYAVVVLVFAGIGAAF